MLIRDLLTYPKQLSMIDAPLITESNPFESEESLLESEFLDVLVDSRRQTAGVLLEFRTALQFRDGIAGLYVARGVKRLLWTSELSRRDGIRAFTIGKSQAMKRGNDIEFSIIAMWDLSLSILSEEAEFAVLDVPGMTITPPDYTEPDIPAIEAALPSWESPCRVVEKASWRGFAARHN
ncbi:hypothetical protein [Propionibacterium australiense]|uniref:hypothetical protein n=1 Tax=Propionibacterium australiense TaxID=119981 RepID=UPI000F83B1C5|nr:hypothetical protein [Propionibacterium australiense]